MLAVIWQDTCAPSRRPIALIPGRDTPTGDSSAGCDCSTDIIVGACTDCRGDRRRWQSFHRAKSLRSPPSFVRTRNAANRQTKAISSHTAHLASSVVVDTLAWSPLAAPELPPSSNRLPRHGAAGLNHPDRMDGNLLGWGTSCHGDIQAQVIIEGGRILSATIAQC